MYLIVLDTLVQNIQDVTEEDVLTSVEQAVKENTTLERLEVTIAECNKLHSKGSSSQSESQRVDTVDKL